MKNNKEASSKTKVIKKAHRNLFTDISQLVYQTKQKVAIGVNAELTALYWHVGNRIRKDVLNEKKAGYGRKIIAKLSSQLTNEFGSGWSIRQLQHCLRFAETFQDIVIANALRSQLSWTQLRILLSIENELKRNFYLEMCKMEKWSSRLLQERINSMLYERTAISKKPELTIKNELKKLKDEQQVSPDLIFRDPYILDFLGLKDTYSEADLESAIIAELQRFIIELGNDFAFLGRQKRITIDDTDYSMDLLFYHRRLKSLVVIDLKLGKFEAGFKGQMELYLRWLEKHEMIEGENTPIGLLLCTEAKGEQVELLQLQKSNIKIAEYITLLPSKKLLKQKLHQAVANAKISLSQSNDSKRG